MRAPGCWCTGRRAGGAMSPPRRDGLTPLVARRPGWRRKAWNATILGACYLSAALVVLPLGLIVSHLLARGLPGLNLAFFFHLPKPVGEPGGGMANAIVGTLMLVGLGSLFSVPIGVGAGVYLAEYGGGGFARPGGPNPRRAGGGASLCPRGGGLPPVGGAVGRFSAAPR